MSKLYYKYGAMNSGKTAHLLQAAHNYEENGMKIIILKPGIDTKGDSKIVTRIGLKRRANHVVKKDEQLIKYLNKLDNDISCVFVDEAQFLTRNQVDELFMFTKVRDIPVICYGLKSDFRTVCFPGSLRLFELADEMQELYTICSCGKRAKFNARIVDGKYTFEGDQIAIDGENEVKYQSLCGKCYLEKVIGITEEDMK